MSRIGFHFMPQLFRPEAKGMTLPQDVFHSLRRIIHSVFHSPKTLLVPKAFRHDAELSRKSNFLVLSLLFIFCIEALNAASFRIFNLSYAATEMYGALTLGCCSLVLARFFYRTGKFHATVNCFMAAGMLQTIIVSLVQGSSIAMDEMLWLATTAIWSFVMTDSRTGLVWSGLSLLLILAYFFTGHMSNTMNLHFDFVISILMGAFVMFVISGNEQNRRKVLQALKEKNAIIETRNKDITDSISYAGRIQRAILPKAEEFNRLFTESFILYKPRDIVSGDFYWVAEKNNHRFVAVVDCTGHGVPGALMSMIGNTLLCEIVEKMNISDPGRILDALREGIIQTLHQTGAAHETKDGMDISLARFTDNGEGRVTIDYAGANNKLWLISPVPEKQFIEIDGDHQPIGIHPRKKAFTTNSFEVRKGTLVYLFSDGFADQFGGPYEKKFKYSQMKTILSMNAGLTMGEQQRRLEQSFFDWKGNLEQVDDVCFIGIRV